MYNLYVEKKKLQEIKKKEQDKIRLIKQEKIHKNKTKDLALKYEDRLRKFIISVSFYIIINQIAEDNPKLIINNQTKRINNSREAFLFENEKLILGKKGLTLKYYPTKKEKLKYFFRHSNRNNKENKNKSNSFNFNSINPNSTFYSNKNFNNNTIDKSTYGLNKNELLSPVKNKTQMNFFKKSPSSLNLKINNNPYQFNNNVSNLSDNNNYTKIKNALYNTIYKPNYKYFSPISKRINKINEKIKYDSLKKRNKKNKLNPFNKTHFKGLESLSVKPKEIYDLFKMEDLLKIKEVGNNYDMSSKQKRDEEKIEKKNEYRLDIKELMEEEQEIQNIINTRAFSNLLGNNKFFKEVEYKKDKVDELKKESKDDMIEDNAQEKNKKMNYLKIIAFKDKLNSNKGLNESYSEDNSINREEREEREQIKKRKKLKDMETELRIDGKVYQMKNQMDKICKKLLIKYKVHENVKNK